MKYVLQYILLILSIIIIILFFILNRNTKKIDIPIVNLPLESCDFINDIKYSGVILYPADKGQGIIRLFDIYDNSDHENLDESNFIGVNFYNDDFDLGAYVNFNLCQSPFGLIAENLEKVKIQDINPFDGDLTDVTHLDLHAMKSDDGSAHSKIHIFKNASLTGGQFRGTDIYKYNLEIEGELDTLLSLTDTITLKNTMQGSMYLTDKVVYPVNVIQSDNQIFYEFSLTHSH